MKLKFPERNPPVGWLMRVIPFLIPAYQTGMFTPPPKKKKKKKNKKRVLRFDYSKLDLNPEVLPFGG